MSSDEVDAYLASLAEPKRSTLERPAALAVGSSRAEDGTIQREVARWTGHDHVQLGVIDVAG